MLTTPETVAMHLRPHQARKKLVEAEQVQERAVAIAENVYGTDHPQVQYIFFFRFFQYSPVQYTAVAPSILPLLSVYCLFSVLVYFFCMCSLRNQSRLNIHVTACYS